MYTWKRFQNLININIAKQRFINIHAQSFRITKRLTQFLLINSRDVTSIFTMKHSKFDMNFIDPILDAKRMEKWSKWFMRSVEGSERRDAIERRRKRHDTIRSLSVVRWQAEQVENFGCTNEANMMEIMGGSSTRWQWSVMVTGDRATNTNQFLRTFTHSFDCLFIHPRDDTLIAVLHPPRLIRWLRLVSVASIMYMCINLFICVYQPRAARARNVSSTYYARCISRPQGCIRVELHSLCCGKKKKFHSCV